MSLLTEAEVVIRATGVDGKEHLLYVQLDMQNLDSGINYDIENIFEAADIYTTPNIKYSELRITVNGRGKPFNADGHFMTLWEDA